MDTAILRLKGANLNEFRALMDLFGTAFGDPESYAAKKPGDAYVLRLLEQEKVIHLAAFSGGELAGGLVAYVLEKFEQERSEVYIYDLAVAESQRRKGIATALIRELKGIAKDLGAWVIYVQADYGDEPAIKLYESLGKREDVMHFDIEV